MKRLCIILLIFSVALSACAVLPQENDDEISKPDSSVFTEESVFPSMDPVTESTAETAGVSVISPTIETKTPEDSDLVRVVDYIPDIVVDLKYATTDNFTGQVIYEFSDAYLRYGTVKKLAAVQEALRSQGLCLKIWDGYRPVYGQYRLWKACPDPTYVSDPTKGTSSHCRGNTVDITLLDASGNELEMPTGFDDFSKKADRDYADCTARAAANAKLLEQLMYDNGFRGYSAEWWHYTDLDAYDIENTFDPAVVSTWYANCNEYITLRQLADVKADELLRIGKNQTMTLLGWSENFAYVDYAGYRGYVLANYILPVSRTVQNELSVVKPTAVYTYDQMSADLKQLTQTYSQWATLSNIGTSENGTEIPVLILGDTDSEHQILIQAGIHAREHMTCWLLTALAEQWLTQGQSENWDVCFHLIPMTNPDGVAISQTGTLPEAAQTIYVRDILEKHTELTLSEYAVRWKANANGVDLNRNFDAGWDVYEGREAPSSERYKGDAPFCAVEAQALRQYTLDHDFDVTVSYHATGSILYATSGQNEKVNELSQELARGISFATGYPIEDASQADAAGYKDWAGDVQGIPSITIEIGCEDNPLERKELESIFARNYKVFQELARWVTNQ